MLIDNQVTHVYFAGMNSDRSVHDAALDTCVKRQQTVVYIVEDACRASNNAVALEGFKKVWLVAWVGAPRAGLRQERGSCACGCRHAICRPRATAAVACCRLLPSAGTRLRFD